MRWALRSCHGRSATQTYYRRAVHFLHVLEATRSQGVEGTGWGYPFDWETRGGTIRAGTPLITTLPYVYEAFRGVYDLDGGSRWREAMRSIAQHALLDYRDVETSRSSGSCAYTPHPHDPAGVVNASAYRACLLMTAAVDFSEARYANAARPKHELRARRSGPQRCVALRSRRTRDFIDHFHTCFVLKALAKIERLTGDPLCTEAIESWGRLLRETPVR